MIKNIFLFLCLWSCDAPKLSVKRKIDIEPSSESPRIRAEGNKTPPQTKLPLSWPDRRPIGMIMLASYVEPYKFGDRKWKLGGQYQFGKKELFAHADESIKNMKQMNAQGMVTWDIEGQQYPHPVSYIGDPTLIKEVAPEMDVIIDSYFKKFTDQGFRVGICIRPDSLVFEKYWAFHYSVKDPAQNLIKKITYAKKRWGCTLFYVDSNVWPGKADIENNIGTGGLMDVSIFKKVSEAFPDCLIMPEHEGEGDYWKYTAPYGDLQRFRIDVPRNVKVAYPKSFQVLIIGDAPVTNEQLQHSIREGNILMFRAWYDDPVNQKIKVAYKGAK